MNTMDRSRTHEMLARQSTDDRARAQFIVDLKRHVRTLTRTNRAAFENRAAPRFRALHGRDPASTEEIGASLATDPFHRLWSALTREAQDMMWNAVESSILRDLPRMREAARRLTRPGTTRGSLTLDERFVPPADVLAAHIHCQPGGYMRDAGDDDVVAGALYESGGNLYSSGVGIGRRDSKAGAAMAYLEQRFPRFRPMRILDLGCSAGGASVAYAATYPDAEVHAVDAGPAILRYAHARAEALGVAVHFHQMDVGRLHFEDASFDLVVSHNLMHEISNATMRRLFAESHRVLRAGGLAVHQDVPIRGRRTPFERYLFAWEIKYNNEPFWQIFADADVPGLLAEAGFAREEIVEADLPRIDGPGAWYVALARRSADS